MVSLEHLCKYAVRGIKNSNSYYPPSIPHSKSKTTTSQRMSTIMASVFFSIFPSDHLHQTTIAENSFLQPSSVLLPTYSGEFLSQLVLSSDLWDKKSESSNFLLHLLIWMLMLLSPFSRLLTFPLFFHKLFTKPMKEFSFFPQVKTLARTCCLIVE